MLTDFFSSWLCGRMWRRPVETWKVAELLCHQLSRHLTKQREGNWLGLPKWWGHLSSDVPQLSGVIQRDCCRGPCCSRLGREFGVSEMVGGRPTASLSTGSSILPVTNLLNRHRRSWGMLPAQRGWTLCKGILTFPLYASFLSRSVAKT